jgi:hypothetical protein
MSAVVNLMTPMNVDTIFIAGRARKWRGNLVGVDVPRVLRSGGGSARRRRAALGLQGGPAGVIHVTPQ